MRSVLLRTVLSGLALAAVGAVVGMIVLSGNGHCGGPACAGLAAIPFAFAAFGGMVGLGAGLGIFTAAWYLHRRAAAAASSSAAAEGEGAVPQDAPAPPSSGGA